MNKAELSELIDSFGKNIPQAIQRQMKKTKS